MKETKLNIKVKNCFNVTYPKGLFDNHVGTKFSKSYPDLFGIFKGLSVRIECKMLKIAKTKKQKYLITTREGNCSGLTSNQIIKINELYNANDATFIVYYKYIKARDKGNGLYLIPSEEIMINPVERIKDLKSINPKRDWERYFCPCKARVGFDIKKVFEREMKLHFLKIIRLWKK